MNAITMPFTESVSLAAIRWRLSEELLIEEGLGWYRLYGRWDRKFGCWVQTNNSLEPFTPDWPFLGKHGLWLEPDGRRDEAWYQSRAALAAYFSLIPTSIRRLVAPHGSRQWVLLETVWRDPSMARILDQG